VTSSTYTVVVGGGGAECNCSKSSAYGGGGAGGDVGGGGGGRSAVRLSGVDLITAGGCQQLAGGVHHGILREHRSQALNVVLITGDGVSTHQFRNLGARLQHGHASQQVF
jgi:hypothetical protein